MLSKRGLSIQEAAKEYYDLGLTVVPIIKNKKRPSISSWSTLSEEELYTHFSKNTGGIGLRWGDENHHLVDIDLDCEEAIVLAPKILPQTKTYGRDSAPESHWIYQVTDDPGKRKAFSVRTKECKSMLLEYRAKRCVSVVEPSIHPSGEQYLWTAHSPEIAKISRTNLLRWCSVLAAAVLTMRCVPAKGARNDQD